MNDVIEDPEINACAIGRRIVLQGPALMPFDQENRWLVAVIGRGNATTSDDD
jgi:hypothetical protein